MSTKKLCFLCSLCWVLLQAKGEELQKSIPPKIEDYAINIVRFNRHFPQEKVYLHMDNRSYFIGDTIWFKAYVMNAATLRPTETSGVLYVELLNEKGVEVEHKKLRLENGMCHGEFALKDNYRTGYYEIRAYTRNMLNFGNEPAAQANDFYIESENETENEEEDEEEDVEFTKQEYTKRKDKKVIATQSLIADYNHTLFSRVFPVYMRPEKPGFYKEEMDFYPMHTQLSFPKETEIDIRPDDLKLSFFPEGGKLVEGLPSIIAFEAVDQWGRKRDIEGYITEGKENRITSFKAFGRGRGTFSLRPEANKSYYAHVTYKGKDYRFELPEADAAGYVLRLSPPVANGAAMFNILGTPNAQRELLGWTLQCRGALTAFDTLTIDMDGNSTVGIPPEKLKPGVNQLTLFNARGEVLADRLFFVCPTMKPATLTLKHLPDSVKPYQKVTLDMNVRDNSYRHTSRSFFSLSVTDADERPDTYDTGDIRSELLLSSDLKGFIEDVDSYFSHKSPRAMAADIDLLMLVQGWRRYEWHTMTDNTFTPRYTPEKGLQIDGYVISGLLSTDKSCLDANSYPRIPHLKMKAALKSSMVNLTDSCYADSLGRFHLNFNCIIHDEAMMTILMETREEDKKWYHHITGSPLEFCFPVIHRAFSPMPQSYTYYQWNTPEQDAARTYDEQINWAMERDIENVTIKKRFKRKSEIYYDNPDMVIDYYKEWNNIIDRGVPMLNHLKIMHTKDYKYSKEVDPEKEKINEKNYIKSTPYFFPNYSLGGRMLMYIDYKKVLQYDPVSRRYEGRNYRPYMMPNRIHVYSNLIHRDPIHLTIDSQTGRRDNVRFVIEYFDSKSSPAQPPYMPKEGRRDTYFEGYSRVTRFYSPDYSECVPPDSVDYRRTLYWNPDVETDFYGNASVTFYNNKQTKHLHVRAEGITEHGEFIVYDSDKQNAR